MQYKHEVPENLRKASVWNDEYSCYQTPGGKFWRYTDDPDCRGESLRDEFGKSISVSVWLTEDGEDPYVVQSREVADLTQQAIKRKHSVPKQVRLTPEADSLLDRLAEARHLSTSDTLRQLIYEEAERRGIH